MKIEAAFAASPPPPFCKTAVYPFFILAQKYNLCKRFRQKFYSEEFIQDNKKPLKAD